MATAKEKPKEIVILEVRNKRTSIYIHWTQGDDDYPVTFHDNPLKSFYAALEGLNGPVLSLAELPASDGKKIEATGITVREKGDVVLALITAKKKLKRNKRVLNISTPILAMYEDEENKGADHMDSDEAAAVEKVIKEAKRYIGGDRAQGQIVFESDKPEGKKGDNTTEFPSMTESPASS